jgi:mitochondrial Rho GTPase 1
MTTLEHRTTLAYMAYLSFPQTPNLNPTSSSSPPPPTTAALQVTRPRATDRQRGKVSRNVFSCYVIGAAGSGKTSLFGAFIGKSFGTYEPTTEGVRVVNPVEINGGEKYLVVSSFSLMMWCSSLREPTPPQLQEFGASTKQRHSPRRRRRTRSM